MSGQSTRTSITQLVLFLIALQSKENCFPRDKKKYEKDEDSFIFFLMDFLVFTLMDEDPDLLLSKTSVL